MTLDEIAIKHGTDKATVHQTIRGHGYSPHYEIFFAEYRSLPCKILEIGVGGGESLRLWREYFSEALVIGVDINPQAQSVEGTELVVGDQSSPSFWEDFHKRFGGAWDIIIDDGSHYAKDIIAAFGCMWRHVNYRGLYCIEDLGVAYGGHPFTQPGIQNHMDFIKDMLDKLNRKQDDMASLYYAEELAIIRKK